MMIFKSLCIQTYSPGLNERIIDIGELEVIVSFSNCDTSSTFTNEYLNCVLRVRNVA